MGWPLGEQAWQLHTNTLAGLINAEGQKVVLSLKTHFCAWLYLIFGACVWWFADSQTSTLLPPHARRHVLPSWPADMGYEMGSLIILQWCQSGGCHSMRQRLLSSCMMQVIIQPLSVSAETQKNMRRTTRLKSWEQWTLHCAVISSWLTNKHCHLGN